VVLKISEKTGEKMSAKSVSENSDVKIIFAKKGVLGPFWKT